MGENETEILKDRFIVQHSEQIDLSVVLRIENAQYNDILKKNINPKATNSDSVIKLRKISMYNQPLFGKEKLCEKYHFENHQYFPVIFDERCS